jgi:hypothetical protein
MPLSPPAERDLLHTRTIEIQGFSRADGQFDIEAHLTDRKSFRFDTAGRSVPTGTPLHEMWVRLTLDETMTITACEATTENGPYSICTQGSATMPRLVGLQIKSGFMKAANERLHGAEGCTHLREVLAQMATTSFQTMANTKTRAGALARLNGTFDSAKARTDDSRAARLIDSCFAYARDGVVVRERWPHLVGKQEG